MANIIKPKRSGTASTVPTLGQLADGEIAINYADKKWYMRTGGIVTDITPTATWNGGTVTGGITVTTAPLVVDNIALRVQNWAGTPGNGVLYFGDAATDNYIFKSGSLFRLRGGTNIVDIDCSTAGKAWHSGMLALQADFNNANTLLRTYFQGSATDGATVVGAKPNGTGTQADFRAYSSSDPSNSSYFGIQATSTAVTLITGAFGTGTMRDISISYNGTVLQKLYTDGHVEAQAYFDSKGAVSGYRFWDRVNTTNAWVLYSTGNTARLSYNSAYEYTFGTGGLFTAQQIVLSGSSAAYFFNDRTTTAQYAWYGSANAARLYNSTSGDVLTVDLSGNMGLAGFINLEGSLRAGYRDLVNSGAANTWAQGKVNKITANATADLGPPADATFMVYNNTAGNLTLVQGSGVTLRKAGTATAGNLTLLPRGFATLWYNTTSEVIVSGHLG